MNANSRARFFQKEGSVGKALKAANLRLEYVEHSSLTLIKRGVLGTVLFVVSMVTILGVMYQQTASTPLPNTRVTFETDPRLTQPDIKTYLGLESMVASNPFLTNLQCPCMGQPGSKTAGIVQTNATQPFGQNYYYMDEHCRKGEAKFAIIKRFPAAFKPHLLGGDPTFHEQFESRFNGTTPWTVSDFITEKEFHDRVVTENRSISTVRLCRAISNLINSNAQAYLKRVLTSPFLMQQDTVIAVLSSRFQHMRDLSLSAINLAYEKDTFRLDFEGVESKWGEDLNRYLDSLHAEDVAAVTEAYAGLTQKILTGRVTEPSLFQPTPVLALLKNNPNATVPVEAPPAPAGEACVQACPGPSTFASICDYYQNVTQSCQDFVASCTDAARFNVQAECLSHQCAKDEHCGVVENTQLKTVVKENTVQAVVPVAGLSATQLRDDIRVRTAVRQGFAAAAGLPLEMVSIVSIDGTSLARTGQGRRLASRAVKVEFEVVTVVKVVKSAAKGAADQAKDNADQLNATVDQPEVAVNLPTFSIAEVIQRVEDQQTEMAAFMQKAAADLGVLDEVRELSVQRVVAKPAVTVQPVFVDGSNGGFPVVPYKIGSEVYKQVQGCKIWGSNSEGGRGPVHPSCTGYNLEGTGWVHTAHEDPLLGSI
eukprot:g1207.t1